ncbi:hypothetical protein [Pantanalinema sp. GBBB05]
MPVASQIFSSNGAAIAAPFFGLNPQPLRIWIVTIPQRSVAP